MSTLSDETFTTIAQNIKGEKDFGNFMLVHKKVFVSMPTKQQNDIINSLCKSGFDVFSIIKKMQDSNVVQLNKELFAAIVEWLCDRKYMNMLKEFLNLHHNEHKKCDDNVKKQIITYLSTEKSFNLEEYINTYYDHTQNGKRLIKFLNMITKMKIIYVSPQCDDQTLEEITRFFEYINKHKWILKLRSPKNHNFYGDLVEMCSKLSLKLNKDVGDKYIKELFPDNVLCEVEKLRTMSASTVTKTLNDDILNMSLSPNHIEMSSSCSNVQNKLTELKEFTDSTGLNERNKSWDIRSEQNPVIIKTNNSPHQSTIIESKDVTCTPCTPDVTNLESEPKSDSTQQSTIIGKYASNDEQIITLPVKRDQNKFNVIVEYLVNNWAFEENNIQVSQNKVRASLRQYQLYDDVDNKRIVLMSNNDSILNFVYTA